jgi:hypothetical protein
MNISNGGTETQLLAIFASADFGANLHLGIAN